MGVTLAVQVGTIPKFFLRFTAGDSAPCLSCRRDAQRPRVPGARFKGTTAYASEREQLPILITKRARLYEHCTFARDGMTAFRVWLFRYYLRYPCFRAWNEALLIE